MSNINISVTEQDPINVSIASPEVQNVDISAQSISASVPDGDKGDIVVTGNGTIWTLDPNALATRVPYTGATADVNLGEFGLLTGNIQFDTSPTNAPTGAGSMVWNNTEGTADLTLRGASVDLPIGQKQVVRAVNGTGGNLTRAAYRAVRITGAQGQRFQIDLARADNDANSKDTIGLVGEDITNNQAGFIVTSGIIANINTTGSLQGETWADGDTLYLSGTTSGVITNVKPAAPIHTVILGFVIYAHANNGKIYVKVDNGYELDELHNVNVSTAASGDYLRYNGTLWVDSTIQAADLPSSIDAAKIGTGVVSNTEFGYLDGVTSAIQTQLNGKQATLTNPVTGTGTSGQVTYFSGTSSVTGSNNLFWDATNSRLGINTASPAYGLDVNGEARFVGTIYTKIGSEVGIQMAPTSAMRNTGGQFIDFGTGGSGDFQIRGGSGFGTFLSILNGGNTGVGNASPSYRLDISGTLRNTTSAYFATSSGNVGIGTTSPAGIFHVQTSAQEAGRFVSTNANGPYMVMSHGATPTTILIVGSYKAGTGGANFATGDGVIRCQGHLVFTAGGATERAVLFQNGNLALGTVTDNGYKLDVQGTLRSTGTAAFATTSGNVGIGTTSYGTSSDKVLSIGTGTAPTNSPVDVVLLYSADISAGKAALHVRTEDNVIIKLYQQSTSVGAATFAANTGTAVNDASTFDGYTLNQIVKALRNNGLLA